MSPCTPQHFFVACISIISLLADNILPYKGNELFVDVCFFWNLFVAKEWFPSFLLSEKSCPFLSPCWGLLFQPPVPLVCGQARHLLIHGSAILRAKMCQTSYSYWFMEHDSCASATWEILVGVLFAVKYINAKLGSSGSPSLQSFATARCTRSFASSKLLLH